MNVVDESKTQRGLWRIDAYEDDIVREAARVVERAEAEQLFQRAFESDLWIPGKITNRLLWRLDGENLVTTNGKGLLLDRLFALGTPPTQVNSMGVGTDATSAAAGQVQLNPSVAGSVLIQAFDALPTRAGTVVTAVSTFATGTANFQWQELGMFNGTTNGTSIIFNRIAPVGPFTKSSAVSIVVTVQLTQS